MALVVIEIAILVFTMFGQGLVQELNDNEQNVVQSKVTARKNYLESVLVNNWMNLENTEEYIVAAAKRLIAAHMISVDTLDESSHTGAPLLKQISEQLIEMMRTNRVTGAYVILNTEELPLDPGSLDKGGKPGIYLRDTDPSSQSSERNEDILLEVSPLEVIKHLGIATDTSWNLQFQFGEDHIEFYEFLYSPFQTAYENGKTMDWSDMGYWGVTYDVANHSEKVLAYSIPLMLADGTAIGVLGIDLTHTYLKTLLPYEELDIDGNGAYYLARYSEETGEFSQILGNGNLEGLVYTENGTCTVKKSHYYAYMEQLQIYNNNAPFSNQQWVLVGMVPYESMLGFVEKLILAVLLAVIVSLIIGIGGSLFISYRLQKPMAALAKEMRVKDPRRSVSLTPTGILEIDQMSEAVETLSRDVIANGRKFSKIIEMASVHLAGFHMDKEKNVLFLTEHFFGIFGRYEISEQDMTIEAFRESMSQFQEYYLERDESVNGYILRIPYNDRWRFIRVRVLEDGKQVYGLAEDVTQALLEKQILKHERDHDALTNLYNRRAFRRKLQELFEEQDQKIGVAAFIMIDLDNLKYINDTYGHEYGDRYIKQAAAALKKSLPEKAYYARISGDEFNVFLYGYQERSEIEAQIRLLQDTMNAEYIELPNGELHRLHASGGISWYPEDSCSYDELSKYADYAMYMVKRSQKGEFGNFDLQQFQSQDALLRSSAALTRMIDKQLVYCVFQPIVHARTGKIFAYEALMRSAVPEISSVKEIMETARREGKLNQIEVLTWNVALETFENLIKDKLIEEDSCLFINSIPNQRMSEKTEQALRERFGRLGRQIVMELTEDEQIDSMIWEEKQKQHCRMGGRIALDDYGTGYNSEKTLLSISPDFIKVDIAIVHDIHKNQDKRTIMEYIVNYAHERGKYIIAEGVEVREEVETILKLGADYMQGFFFARPQRIPSGVSQESLQLLEELGKE